jgi:hypothetical protein
MNLHGVTTQRNIIFRSKLRLRTPHHVAVIFNVLQLAQRETNVLFFVYVTATLWTGIRLWIVNLRGSENRRSSVTSERYPVIWKLQGKLRKTWGLSVQGSYLVCTSQLRRKVQGVRYCDKWPWGGGGCLFVLANLTLPKRQWFSPSVLRHTVRLLGQLISPSQDLYLHRTTQHRPRTNIQALIGTRRSRPASQTVRPLDCCLFY